MPLDLPRAEKITGNLLHCQEPPPEALENVALAWYRPMIIGRVQPSAGAHTMFVCFPADVWSGA